MDLSFRPLAKQALHNLEQIRQDTDQAKKKENDLLADLREKAAGRGLTIKDDDEQISDMISALCHQLEIKKGLKYSDDKLKTELVQYHKDNPDLVCKFVTGVACIFFFLRQIKL